VSSDLEQFLELNNDRQVVRFMVALDRTQAIERLRANEHEWQQHGHGLLAVLERSSGRFLGRAGLKYWPQFEETEAGWALFPAVWGQGYASEAARACIDWGFSKFPFPYLTAMIQPQNERSLRLARSLGFEELRRETLLGKPVIVHALTRERHLTDGNASELPRG
jgi:RimJ/RimL family protein N-acetyltransferase